LGANEDDKKFVYTKILTRSHLKVAKELRWRFEERQIVCSVKVGVRDFAINLFKKLFECGKKCSK
jgi:hypothetical protein